MNELCDWSLNPKLPKDKSQKAKQHQLQLSIVATYKNRQGWHMCIAKREGRENLRKGSLKFVLGETTHVLSESETDLFMVLA